LLSAPLTVRERGAEIARVGFVGEGTIANVCRHVIARQRELNFRALVLQMVLPDGETLEFWRATIDNPQELPGFKTAQHSRFCKFLIRRQKHSAMREVLHTIRAPLPTSEPRLPANHNDPQVASPSRALHPTPE